MSTSNIQKIFEATTQTITKVGGSSGDVSGALLAIQQSLGKDIVASEEFRQQFAERIPGAMKMAADAMGVTTSEFQKLMESGQVVAKDFWPKLADEMNKFSQGWQASSDTIDANLERLKNASKEFADSDFMSSIVSGALNSRPMKSVD
jgi:tape measure domain-containing protein